MAPGFETLMLGLLERIVEMYFYQILVVIEEMFYFELLVNRLVIILIIIASRINGSN